MLINQTLDKLDALGLYGMTLGLREQLESSQYTSLSFDERLGRWSIGNQKRVTAVGWPSDSKLPSCARRRPSRTSTSGPHAGWTAR